MRKITITKAGNGWVLQYKGRTELPPGNPDTLVARTHEELAAALTVLVLASSEEGDAHFLFVPGNLKG